jgi:transposase InsO family protein
VLTVGRAPNRNAFAERFVRTIQDECLSKLICVGEGMLHRALREFVAHYHEERNHQGVGNRLLRPRAESLRGDGPIVRRERLGGLLNFYFRKRRAS